MALEIICRSRPLGPLWPRNPLSGWLEHLPSVLLEVVGLGPVPRVHSATPEPSPGPHFLLYNPRIYMIEIIHLNGFAPSLQPSKPSVNILAL